MRSFTRQLFILAAAILSVSARTSSNFRRVHPNQKPSRELSKRVISSPQLTLYS